MSGSKKGSNNFQFFVDGASNLVHTVKERPNGKKGRRPTSVEDLAMQGFHIGRVLGEGSYCKVKSATYGGRDIAVKVISKSQLSIGFTTKFLPREIDVLSKVSHRNIIHIYKIFSYPEHVFMFMELIQRGDLLELIKDCGRLSEGEACHYFQQIVSATRYLHQLNVAHRDLKCENIMITEDNEIKIIDFGFCRSTVNNSGRRELSETFCGSAAYAAPEVIQGFPYNPMMCDVWSLGCVLFIMVTGIMPFDDSNIRRMLMSQLDRQLLYPLASEVSNSGKSLISRMLEPDIIRRSTIHQVAQCVWIQEMQGEFP